MNKENIKAIVFDFWGVFADFNAPVSDAVGLVGDADEFNEDYYKLIIQHDLGNMSEDEFLAQTSKIFKIPLTSKHRYLFNPNDINHELIKIAQQLKKKFKIGLISNTPESYTDEFIFKPGLDELFDCLVLSYEERIRKPDPAIFEHAIKKLGLLPDEILFVDDHQPNLDAAAKVGMKVLLYEGEKTNKTLMELS